MTGVRIGTAATAAVASLLLATAVGAATPRLSVQPANVARGGAVTVSGRGCLAGDVVYLISTPFLGHAFVAHSVATRARANGSFSRRVRIRMSAHVGRYLITARCGGGNLGVAARLRVH
jgi:hypothetical protein